MIKHINEIKETVKFILICTLIVVNKSYYAYAEEPNIILKSHDFVYKYCINTNVDISNVILSDVCVDTVTRFNQYALSTNDISITEISSSVSYDDVFIETKCSIDTNGQCVVFTVNCTYNF